MQFFISLWISENSWLGKFNKFKRKSTLSSLSKHFHHPSQERRAERKCDGKSSFPKSMDFVDFFHNRRLFCATLHNNIVFPSIHKQNTFSQTRRFVAVKTFLQSLPDNCIFLVIQYCTQNGLEWIEFFFSEFDKLVNLREFEE